MGIIKTKVGDSQCYSQYSTKTEIGTAAEILKNISLKIEAEEGL